MKGEKHSCASKVSPLSASSICQTIRSSRHSAEASGNTKTVFFNLTFFYIEKISQHTTNQKYY